MTNSYLNIICIVRNFAFILLLFSISCKTDSPIVKNRTRPNIIFIMSDDHAYQAISAYDNKLIQTPHIDRLAKEGMLFRKAFVTNSICSPSRAVALTGKFSHLNSVRDNSDVFDTIQVTFPKILQKNGYETAIYGKWHLKSTPQGFDHWKVLPGQGDYYHPKFNTPSGKITVSGYVTDIITDMAIEYLDSIRDKNKPFMLMYNHKAPHRSWWPSIDDLDDFKNKKIPIPATLFDDYKNRGLASKEAEMQISKHMALSLDNKISPEILDKLNMKEFIERYKLSYKSSFNRLTEEEKKQWQKVYGPINKDFYENTPKGQALILWKYQRYLEDYLSTIKNVDKNLGRILNYLDENNLSKNTIIIYTSDQGFYLGEHGWFDKRFMYEESFRTPLIIRYPKLIEKNSVNSDLVQNIDLAPTILDIAGVAIPTDMQGKSMKPLFEGKNKEWRDALYYHYYEYPGVHMVKRHYGIRTERYKLIHFYYDIDQWELYDLEKDPNEMNNVYNQKEYLNIQKELHNRLVELRNKYKDSRELDLNFIKKDSIRLARTKKN